jgi:hypothetical protein
MGMSIEEAIEFYNGLECYTPQAKDARDTAIDTMHKYQKIEQIVKSKTTRLSYEDGFRQIKEVLEDGKID